MRLLYIVLVLCTIAVIGTAAAIYVRVRRHGQQAHPADQATPADPDAEPPDVTHPQN